MNDIPCQGCKPEDKGCITCGGYKKVLVVGSCPKCKRQYLSRPGDYTAYESKQWTSFDGLEMIVQKDFGSICLDCHKNEEVKPITDSKYP